MSSLIVDNSLAKDMAKDHKHVYDRGQKIETYDIVSFVRIDDNYCKDKQGIYYNHQLLPGSNADDFQIKDIYIISNGNIYLYNNRLSELDIKTFELVYTDRIADSCGRSHINGSIIKDKNGIYHQTPDYNSNNSAVLLKKLKQIDRATFRLKEVKTVGYGYNEASFEDKNGVYSIKPYTGEDSFTHKCPNN